MQVRRRKTCRACDADVSRLHLVLSLAPTPPANAFTRSSAPQDCYPLDLYACDVCEHVQLLDVLDPDELFRHYVYQSGTSKVFRQHFEDYAHALVRDWNLGPSSFALEIGSNDGVLLKALQERGVGRALGVDPAEEVAAIARRSGVDTITAFFSSSLGEQICKSSGRPADIVIANNVFAHADDLHDILVGVDRVLKDDGVFVLEVQYLGSLLQAWLVDNIYHEHLSYWHIHALKHLLRRVDFGIRRVEFVDTHGGSLRVFAQRLRVREMLDGPGQPDFGWAPPWGWDERWIGQSGTWPLFKKFVDARGELVRHIIQSTLDEGHRVVGFGAPAKATTLLYQWGLGREHLAYLVDDSPLKQGMLSPGLHIPVLPSDALYQEPTALKEGDRILLLAWNFAASIIDKHRELTNRGVSFLLPMRGFHIR